MDAENHATTLHSIVAGVLGGVMSDVVLPAVGVVNGLERLLIPVLSAILAGFGYALGADLYKRLKARVSKSSIIPVTVEEPVIKDKPETD